jgi:ABC-2 type transport system ATP-binding protein
MSEFLSLKSVSKRFQDHLAVDKVSLDIPKGKIFGLLGPNGAGKTTIIRMITGIFLQDEGEILFDGKPLSREDVSRIGYMPEERGLYKKTKVIEQITYLLRLKGLDRKKADAVAREWLDRMGLGDWTINSQQICRKGCSKKCNLSRQWRTNPIC